MTEAAVLPDVTIENLLASGWETILDGVAEKDCYSYARALETAGTQAEKEGTHERVAALRFLARVCAPMVWNNEEGPLGPAALLDAISDAELDLVNALATHATDPELAARLHDILWLRRADRRAARSAVGEYLQSARRLFDPSKWTTGFARTERAVSLATSLGKKNASYVEVLEAIEADLVRLDAGDPMYLSARLMELQLALREGDHIKGAARANSIAEVAARDGDWWRANELYEIAGKWLTRGGDAEGARRARVAAAEAFVSLGAARAAAEPGVAALHLQAAVEAYRRIGKEQARADELRQLMADYQLRAAAGFATFSTTIDLTADVQRAMELIRGKGSVPEALIALATITPSPVVSEIREAVLADAAQSPLKHLVTRVAVEAKTGRVTGRQAAATGSTGGRSLETAMLEHAKFRQGIIASFVEPLRLLIGEEHPIHDRDILPLVQSSPFVPPARVERFARGLGAGLRGDFLVAAALLIPQVESALRFVVQQRGGQVYSLGDDGVQDAYQLPHLLGLEVVREVLGEDIVFDLRGLLTERFGTNLRNLEAHGLLDDHEYDSTPVAYFWWLMLRLCVLSSLAANAYVDRAAKVAAADGAQEEENEK